MSTEARHVRLLPVSVANKIAAGEVIERPSSVVKELVENSLDAGATRVEVKITMGGKKLVAISDDGCGMGHDDALMCLEPQATSKIRNAEDIERIDTYGFRGEAIPSIAAVSRMTIRTGLGDGAPGTEIAVAGGAVQYDGETGFPRGTTIEVRDLFFNVPARMKFLRSYATEEARIKSTFVVQALARPDVAMRLNADGRDVYNLAGGADYEERIADLFGNEFLGEMRRVDYTRGDIHVGGFVGVPTLTRSSTREQYVFVNRRAATAAIIAHSLSTAYPAMDDGRKPVVILFIDLPPTDVDVNVHPAKREVRFRDAPAVREAIVAAIHNALSPDTPVEFEAFEVPADGTADGTDGTAVASGAAVTAVTARTSETIAHFTPPWERTVEPSPSATPAASESAPPSATPQVAAQPAVQPSILPPQVDGAPWRRFLIVGRLSSGFVVLDVDDGYVVLDPRAAHERVLYERMLERTDSADGFTQPLLIPASVELTPDDAARIRANLDDLRRSGYDIVDQGDDYFMVEALPVGVDSSDCTTLLSDLSQSIAASGVKRGAEDWRRRAVARAAAKVSVSRGRTLSPAEIEKLVNSLAHCKMPYVSPQGRPTMLLTTVAELNRKFGRT